ncbi:50S ribosomal protein L2 [Candidatus Nardonella dryophthoridicola]|uniref:Large ribosomal subunit protein uL2 n=1 Tax=endosymbiont of Rhynchophorus ferrugineus TaxID=1972133 RepID=A0A2Z5TPW0_9GAMM|nr:50S ribosomal protein L2 [Candidatus Nardonella dryophthoridicola]BBA85094.1 50S ribosomal protein L2 [endosymbiont of Rhynchophorus ferrugineus]
MILIKSKPVTPGLRHYIKNKNNFLYKKKKFINKLIVPLKRNFGRNNLGKITTRHIEGGHKKKYRIIDFKRNKIDIIGYVKRFEYDPNRSCYIALIFYKDGDKRYIISPKNINLGDKVISINNYNENFLKIGNSLKLVNIPIGYKIHNIEINPGEGGKISRSAGNYSQIVSKDNKYVIIKIKSGEIRKINNQCRATIGEVGNNEHMLKKIGKAGRKRWMGVRPTVRGTAMNPVDHPHGGGEGRNFGRHPVTPWGKNCKGMKTRNNKKTNKYIIKRRK